MRKESKSFGPYTVEYVRGYSKINGRDFVDFGGLSAIKLYNQEGRNVDINVANMNEYKKFKREQEKYKKELKELNNKNRFNVPW